MESAYETFEHDADIGIRGWGATLAEAAQNAARAMFSVMVDLDGVEESRSVTVVSKEGADREIHFVGFLNDLLASAHLNHMVFSRFEVKFKGDKWITLAWGEPLDEKKHAPTVEVKGATLTAVEVGLKEGRYVAQCVVDV